MRLVGTADDQAPAQGSSYARPLHRSRRSHRRPARRRELVWCVVALVAATVFELGIAAFTRSKGVALTGDEPSYIFQAQAYFHLSPGILSTITADLHANALSAYPVGALPSSVARFIGPQGVISPFEPGLGLFLTPFVATGRLVLGATTGVVVFNSAGLILVHRRVSHLADLGRRSQVLLGLMLAAPAVLVAGSQIYPDLPSGVLLACAVVEIATIERKRASGWFGVAVVTVSAAYLPWLQIKNMSIALVLVVAFLVVHLRAGGSRPRAAAVAVVCLCSWGLLLAYNARYFGHVLGLPEPRQGLNGAGLEYSLGLLFDRHQGLFVQLPFAVVGVVGLWMALRKLPIAVVATAVSVALILVLNGTYTANPYGGLSLAGRFMWTAMPVLIAWTGVVLARSQASGRLMWAPFLVVGGLWLYPAAAVVAGRHVYYNAFSSPLPWDPASWPGWWPGLNRILPQFDLPGHPFGAPALAVVVCLALAAVLAVAAWQYAQGGTFSRGSITVLAVLAVAVGLAFVVVRTPGPTRTLRYSGADLGAPVVGVDLAATSPLIPLQGILSGTYGLTLEYRLGGTSATGRLVVMCLSADQAPLTTSTDGLRPGQQTTMIVIRCSQPGFVATQLRAGTGSSLTVDGLQLRSLSG
jgi:hypothetical protein